MSGEAGAYGTRRSIVTAVADMNASELLGGSAPPCLLPSKDADNLVKPSFHFHLRAACRLHSDGCTTFVHKLVDPAMPATVLPNGRACAFKKPSSRPDRLDRDQKTPPAHPRRCLISKGGMPMPSDVAMVVTAIVGLFIFFAAVLAFGDRTWRTTSGDDGLQG